MSATQREEVENLQYHYRELYRLGKKFGYDNIMEKAKIKEVLMGYELGDTVFSKSNSML